MQLNRTVKVSQELREDFHPRCTLGLRRPGCVANLSVSLQEVAQRRGRDLADAEPARVFWRVKRRNPVAESIHF